MAYAVVAFLGGNSPNFMRVLTRGRLTRWLFILSSTYSDNNIVHALVFGIHAFKICDSVKIESKHQRKDFKHQVGTHYGNATKYRNVRNR